MKKSFFFLGLILLAGFGSSFGQPFSIIDKLTSPQSTIACPAPVHTSYGHTLGFFPTIPVHDTIIVKCYFGDGTDTTQNQIVSIYDSTNLYLFNYPHIYSTPGMYVSGLAPY